MATKKIKITPAEKTISEKEKIKCGNCMDYHPDKNSKENGECWLLPPHPLVDNNGDIISVYPSAWEAKSCRFFSRKLSS